MLRNNTTSQANDGDDGVSCMPETMCKNSSRFYLQSLQCHTWGGGVVAPICNQADGDSVWRSPSNVLFIPHNLFYRCHHSNVCEDKVVRFDATRAPDLVACGPLAPPHIWILPLSLQVVQVRG